MPRKIISIISIALKANEKCIRHAREKECEWKRKDPILCMSLCVFAYYPATPLLRDASMFDVSSQRPKRKASPSVGKKYEAKISSIRFPFQRHKRAMKRARRKNIAECFLWKGFDITADFNGCLSSASKTKEMRQLNGWMGILIIRHWHSLCPMQPTADAMLVAAVISCARRASSASFPPKKCERKVHYRARKRPSRKICFSFFE